jgi:transcriptional regulator GlxA family with amidase domain
MPDISLSAEKTTPHKIKVAVLIYHGVELVDMNGPVDVFLHANRLNNLRYLVYTVAATRNAILSEDDVVTITPQYDIINCPEPDIIVIPGIIKHEPDETLINWIKKLGENKKLIMSVCIGAFILAKTGLLDGKQATTHYLSIDDLHKQYPGIIIVKNVRFVQDGHFITTGGVTSGIDGALHVVETNDGSIIAQQVADMLIYNREAPLPPFTILPPYYNT